MRSGWAIRGRRGGSSRASRPGMGKRERDRAERENAEHFRGGQDGLGGRPLPHAQPVHEGEEADGGQPNRKLRAGRPPGRLTGVDREDARDRRDHGRLDHRERGPAEDEREPPAEPLPDEAVEAAGLRVRHRDLGEDEGSRHREESAHDPRRQHQRLGVKLAGHGVRRPEDAGADDASDRHRGRGVEADLPLEERLCQFETASNA